MVVSLIHPQAFGFAKVIAWEVLPATRSQATRGAQEAASTLCARDRGAVQLVRKCI